VRLVLSAFVLINLGLWEPEFSEARTWYVLEDGSGDAPTIQAAIDSSSNGDSVLVAPGHYLENLNLRGRRIHLRSESGPGATILDGSGKPTAVIICKSGETNETIIEGLTITGGTGFENQRWGGGVFCLEAWPIIRGNVIRENRVNSGGGGIEYCNSNHPDGVGVIEGNLIEHNVSVANGAGIDLESPCVVQNNLIRHNQTENGDGGGIYNGASSTPIRIIQNIFVDNVAADKGGGLHLSVDQRSAGPHDIEIAGNLFLDNKAYGKDVGSSIRICRGGAIFASGVFWIHHNTIIFNYAQTPFANPDAGAVCLVDTDVGKIFDHNLVYANSGGGVAGYTSEGSGTAELSWNLIYSNPLGDSLSTLGFTFHLEDNNTYLSPLLCTDNKMSMGELAENSPALTSPSAPIGAVSAAGCGPIVAVQPSTWSRIKLIYGSPRGSAGP